MAAASSVLAAEEPLFLSYFWENKFSNPPPFSMILKDVQTTASEKQRNSTTSSSSAATESNGLSHHQYSIPRDINPNRKQPYTKEEIEAATYFEQKRRRMYRVALNMFNKKPDNGLQMLIDWQFVDDHPSAIGKFMLTRRGLAKKMVGEFLGTLHSSYHAAVLKAVLSDIEMTGKEIDNALREMIMHFQLPTEAQKIDYVIQAISFCFKFNQFGFRNLPIVISNAIFISYRAM
jgi:Sec7-like guanine-nucleotide exchange factor